jgi:hypothetical protein
VDGLFASVGLGYKVKQLLTSQLEDSRYEECSQCYFLFPLDRIQTSLLDDVDPSGVQRAPSIPSCEPGRVRECFSQDIVRAIHVGIDLDPGGGSIQPARHAPAEIFVVVFYGFLVDKRASGRVGFFRFAKSNARVLAFIAEFRDKALERDRNEILVVLSPEVNLLFPFIILANDERVDPVLDAPVHDKSTHLVHLIVDLVVPFQRQPPELVARSSIADARHQPRLSFIIVLIHGFCYLAVDDNRHVADIICQGYKIVQS